MRRASSYKPKDRFRDWHIAHKSVVAVLAGLFTAGVVQAFVAIGAGGLTVKSNITLPHSTEHIWPWVHDIENRPRWQTYLTNTARMTGTSTDTQSTRLLFWKLRGKSWTGLEVTQNIVPQRLYDTYQESDIDARHLVVRLEPIDACNTTLVIVEKIRFTDYSKRFCLSFISGNNRTDWIRP